MLRECQELRQGIALAIRLRGVEEDVLRRVAGAVVEELGAQHVDGLDLRLDRSDVIQEDLARFLLLLLLGLLRGFAVHYFLVLALEL